MTQHGRPATTVRVTRLVHRGLTVRISTLGSPDGRAFVLVPGIGVSSDYFERLAPRLDGHGTVHALDLPGFAGVRHPGRALQIREYADLVGAAIDELGLDDPVLVGHSMGTQMVADLAARRPGISTLVMISPVVDPAARSVPVAAVRFLRSSLREPRRIQVLAIRAYLVCGVRWFLRVLPRMMSFPIEARLPGIRASALVIRGEHDAVVPRAWVEEMGRLLPRARVWEIPGAAHSVMHDHADEVARLCLAHLERPPAEGSSTEDSSAQLRRFPVGEGQRDEEHADFAPTFRDSIRALRAQVAEGIAIRRDDDAAIGRAKTAHAEAMADAAERARRRQAWSVPGGRTGTRR
ncbi:alpha/beta fold hydrolase [Clavibacter michiganensis]|uniref:alpha/beta fold hydrolase n=1 Tax=Clavibacter michiganensis TaxID=28447 RepID=UPI000A39BA05|nr:alpha/beta fold hydrolase [Clavibacter michiganensis]MDO4100691.1 alpha/beta fold hydrolase [Clavibacter michiganensis]MDO4128117.1 alpha/beta fold hydrolase [Clavibacter michiganensis]NIY58967.1 alpha/beta fold hydrolase [Clavibacter michiganensis subsp. michiganensis]OUE22360.1 Tropinesterase [Clavibacter michiganensis subsp. michiganensis]QXP02894.1 alpha/beta hydrolase [Clavibacter michiganensis subsp. michiganensis]